jgi:hypothetical protein
MHDHATSQAIQIGACFAHPGVQRLVTIALQHQGFGHGACRKSYSIFAFRADAMIASNRASGSVDSSDKLDTAVIINLLMSVRAINGRKEEDSALNHAHWFLMPKSTGSKRSSLLHSANISCKHYHCC